MINVSLYIYEINRYELCFFKKKIYNRYIYTYSFALDLPMTLALPTPEMALVTLLKSANPEVEPMEDLVLPDMESVALVS